MADEQQTGTFSPIFASAKLVEVAFDCLAKGEVKRDTPHGELIWQKAMDARTDILAHEPASVEDALILIQLGRDSADAISGIVQIMDPENEDDAKERLANLAAEVASVFAKLRAQIETQTGVSLHSLGLDLVGITRQ